jgi:WD40 repeat protein
MAGGRVWDVATGRQTAVLQTTNAIANTARFSPDGRRLVATFFADPAEVWDARSGQRLAMLRGHTDMINGAVFSPDGTRVLTASRDHTARVWDAATGRQLLVLQGPDEVWAASFDPHGARIVALFLREARVWDAVSGRQVASFAGEFQGAWFSADGSRIAAAASRGAEIRDAATGRLLARLSGHGGIIYNVNFSADGARVVTASFDRTARIWDVDATRFDARQAERAACATTIAGDLSRLSDAELDRAPALDRLLDRNTCAARSPWVKLVAALGFRRH